MSRLETDINKKEKHLSECRRENDALNHSLLESTTKLQLYESQINQIETEYTSLKQEQEMLVDKHEHTDESLRKTNTKYEKKCEDFSKIEKELSSYFSKMKQIEIQLKQKDARIKDILRENREYSSEIERLNSQIDNLRMEMSHIRGDSLAIEVLRKNLEIERDKAIDETVSYCNSFEALKREKEKLIKEVSDYSRSNSDLQLNLSEKEKENQKLDTRVVELTRKLSIYEREGDDTMKDYQKLKNENRVLTAKLERLQEDTLKEVSDKYSTTIKLKAELDTVKSELQKRNRLLEKQSSSIKSDDGCSDEYKKDLIRMKEQMKKLSNDEAKAKSELLIVRNKLEVYTKERLKMEEQMKQIALSVEREKTRLEGKDKELRTLQNKHEREKLSYHRKIEVLNVDLNSRSKAYEEQLKAARSTHLLELEAKKVEIDSLKRQIKFQDIEMSGSHVGLNFYTNKLDSKSKEVVELVGENLRSRDGYERTIAGLESDLEFARQQYRSAVLHHVSPRADRIPKQIVNDDTATTLNSLGQADDCSNSSESSTDLLL